MHTSIFHGGMRERRRTASQFSCCSCCSEDVCLINNKKTTTTTTTRSRRRAAKKFGKKQPRKRWEKMMTSLNEYGWKDGWMVAPGERKGEGDVLQNKQIDKQATTLLLCGQQCQRATTWPIKVTHERVSDAVEEGREGGASAAAISARRGDIIEWTASNGADIVAGTGSGPNGIWMHQRQQQHSTATISIHKYCLVCVCVCVCPLPTMNLLYFRFPQTRKRTFPTAQKGAGQQIEIKG